MVRDTMVRWLREKHAEVERQIRREIKVESWEVREGEMVGAGGGDCFGICRRLSWLLDWDNHIFLDYFHTPPSKYCIVFRV